MEAQRLGCFGFTACGRVLHVCWMSGSPEPRDVCWSLHLLSGLQWGVCLQGAQTVLRAAQAPDLQGKHVLYMHNLQEAKPSAAAKDAGLAGELWQRSLQAVGLNKAEDDRLWPIV
jgi:hypothetical protein